MYQYDNFTECYLGLADIIFNNPDYICAPRGLKIKEKIGCSFRIKNPRDRMLFVPSRKFSVHYLVAELLWYLSGENKTEWISNYSSFWKNISDDGKTANSAYGARIFKPNSAIASSSIVQWDYIKKELERDPDSRRAVIHIRSAWDSFSAKLDVPCTLTLQFFIRDEKLHMVTNMRSSDLILGIAYDIPAFTIFQELLAKELNVDLGEYTHISNSLHIYEHHFKMVEKMLSNDEVTHAHSLQQKIGEMPEITMTPPINDLYEFEHRIRSYEDATSIIDELDLFTSTFDEYWSDWAKVLASHRCKKLNNGDLCKELMNSTFYSGFHEISRS